MTATQMNVRIDAALKRAGDAALAERGSTPSQAVRAMWEYLALHGTLPAAIEHLIEERALEDAQKERSAQRTTLDEGTMLISGFFQRTGIEEPADFSPSYEDIRAWAASEQMEKWGLA